MADLPITDRPPPKAVRADALELTPTAVAADTQDNELVAQAPTGDVITFREVADRLAHAPSLATLPKD